MIAGNSQSSGIYLMKSRGYVHLFIDIKKEVWQEIVWQECTGNPEAAPVHASRIAREDRATGGDWRDRKTIA
jgi:hypothetical protein